MTPQQALMTVARHFFAAASFGLLLLLALEWLMPGAALPFFDVMDFLPWVLFVTLALFIPVKRRGVVWPSVQIAVGSAVALGLLAIVYLRVSNYAPVTLGLWAAGLGGVAVWSYSCSAKPE